MATKKPTKKTAAISLAETAPLATRTSTGSRRFDAAALDELVKTGRALPQVGSLEAEGDGIRGIIGEPGPSIEYTDAAGDEKLLPTIEIDTGDGVVVALICGHQLLKELPPLVGCDVTIVRGAQKDLGKKRVNRYLIVQHTDADGKPVGQ